MKKNIAVIYAIVAEALYAINASFSKMLLTYVQPTMMASLLYLGAGLGLFLYAMLEKLSGKKAERERPTKKELPYVIRMVVLDIIHFLFLVPASRGDLKMLRTECYSLARFPEYDSI